MKTGQVYRSTNEDRDLFYLVINDYGKYRPLNLNGIVKYGTNMSFDLCPEVKESSDRNGFYKGDILVAESLEDFLGNTSDK